jgi:hypothetical protein
MAHNGTVRRRISNDLAVTDGGLHQREETANPLFWNILRVSRLFAIFCAHQGISELGKCRRIRNLAASAPKNNKGVYIPFEDLAGCPSCQSASPSFENVRWRLASGA